jgi:hypothetical protein
VVVEPAGLPAAFRSSVIAAGSRSVFTNSSGDVFLAAAAQARQSATNASMT